MERTPGPEVMENMTATEVLSEARHASGTFEDFYREHRARMNGLAYVLTGARDVVDEIVHDAFVSVYPKWRADELRDPVAYLKQTVVNRCRAWRARAGVERARSIELDEDLDCPRTCTAPTFEDAPAVRSTLRAAMQMLPPNQRTAITLRYFEDLPIEEIARLMGGAHEGVPAATVRSWIRRALRTLAQVKAERELLRD
jgi:RNA polymerase sigma factor (sigma-70 family)